MISLVRLQLPSLISYRKDTVTVEARQNYQEYRHFPQTSCSVTKNVQRAPKLVIPVAMNYFINAM